MGPRAESPSLKPPVVSWSLMVSNCLCVRAAPHRRRRRCAFYPKRERATGQARARCWCGREYRVEQSLLVSSLSRRLVRMSAVRCVSVRLPFASWRAGAGAARTGPNVRRRGGEATHRPERAARARAGRQLRRCRRRAGRWFRRRDLAARSFASWGRAAARQAGLRFPFRSPLGGPVPRPGRRASARPSGYASRYGAGVHAAGLFVSLSV